MNRTLTHTYILLFLLLLVAFSGCNTEHELRKDVLLNDGWSTVANDTNKFAFDGFENTDFNTENWQEVEVPHNWDDYGGYRRLRHGNRHGYAWYRKSFQLEEKDLTKQYFLWFEGVGSYATVWLNGDSVGYHAGGRTTFTFNISESIKTGENSLAVRADHPADIRDLPWVCGGCSPEWGFCEGSQPMGIFRPVHLIETNPIRVEPFGIHIWNNNETNGEKTTLNLQTEVKNYGIDSKTIQVKNILLDKAGKKQAEVETVLNLDAGQTEIISQVFADFNNPNLWSLENPYIYTVETQIWQGGECVDKTTTPYGIRTIQWDIFGENASNRFYLNGKLVFINGTAEYEHLMGKGHAFSQEMVESRIAQFKAMGFNSFRDGHQPHNFRYHEAWDKDGILWWPQMTAHIWFDNPEFRTNFKQLLRDWIKERRNSPSVILWGLENESTLPEDFAIECSELIRELDPTASSQRLVTTCNGGSGTDWNVIQNWSGTYGGNPENYANELSEQLLNGEYGAWRSIDLHTEGEFDQNGIYSEDRINLLMESKIRLGEEASGKACGQYHWLMTSHDNPGRTQSGEGMRDIDRVGPVNYKGAMTIWGEPLDLFYLFRSNYAPKETEPMVYIVSHTWPDRWTEPGVKDGIRIFTNCDEVELFNSLDGKSLGRKKRGEKGTHIVFNQVDIQYNLLKAIAYVDGKKAAEDVVVLHHLPLDPALQKMDEKVISLTAENTNYVYRVNCGGADYTDKSGNIWKADRHQTSPQNWGSLSWTDEYEGLPPFYGSQRQTFDLINATSDDPLIQSFRYGQHKLKYNFPVQNGEYNVELYFVEPWYGTGGSLDCKNWRVFDVAINENVVLNDLDIWSEAGHDKLLKKTVPATATNGKLEISFPNVKAGQAVISAIAISTKDNSVQPAPDSKGTISKLTTTNDSWKIQSWLATGVHQYTNAKGQFYQLAPELFGADWIQTPEQINSAEGIPAFSVYVDAEVYIGFDTTLTAKPEWLNDWSPLQKFMASTQAGGTVYQLYKKRFAANCEVQPSEINDKKMYPIVVLPITNLDDPIDLRKSTKWEAEDGKFSGNAQITKHLDKTCVSLKNQNGTAGLKFQVGLASKYGLEFRFINLSGDELKADVRIMAADNREMWSGEWIFPSTPDKWKSYRTDTQTTINAGTYYIEITPKTEGPLYFDWVKVQ
ncbi:malectin domain-containing carbohydrate-binding protein [uncultured Draconibacterium sp.]|uniref:malectin domain-containing carbohydrate-binding protein n=1 Tax=uncultured Draconibacterium sp. TaxID=1573823 RepID=UPI0032168D52